MAEYQNKICILAQEENGLGRLLKEYGKQDQTRAGKMMTAVGKSLSYTAQQRVALRNPLVRLFQEVDTFQSRAVEDACHTVEEMEKVRTEYRGALMWMKNISQDFNPDHYQQLEKFREVQTLVKQKKSKFDQMKIKNLQKIELLAASRCNMFSHALILYQNNLITFSEKTAKTLNSVASNFKGYQPYKFHVIKELAEPEELIDNEQEEEEEEKKNKIGTELEGDDKTFFRAEYHDEEKEEPTRSKVSNRADKVKKKAKLGKDSDSLVNLFNDEETDTDPLLSFENETPTENSKKEINSLTSSFADVDLLSDDVPNDVGNTSTEEILKELFDSPVHGASKQTLPVFDFTNNKEPSSQNEVFDMLNKDLLTHPSPAPSSSCTSTSQIFMPSHLLDFGLKNLESENATAPALLANQSNLPQLNADLVSSRSSLFSGGRENTLLSIQKATGHFEAAQQAKQAKLDWYKVFQDIDPLADPGSAIFGKGVGDKKC